jgi:hypothetical protein
VIERTCDRIIWLAISEESVANLQLLVSWKLARHSGCATVRVKARTCLCDDRSPPNPVPDDRTKQLETSVRRTGWPCPAGIAAGASRNDWHVDRPAGNTGQSASARPCADARPTDRSRLRRAAAAGHHPSGWAMDCNVRVWAILLGGSRSEARETGRQRWSLARLRRHSTARQISSWTE